MAAGAEDEGALRARLQCALAARAQVRLALMFGSYARGAAGADSDVDLAVDAVGEDLLSLAAALTAACGRQVDLVRLDDPGVPLLEELIRDAEVLYEAQPGQGAAWRAKVLSILETDRPWYARMRDAWLARVANEGL